jgi:hypothetical protein
MGSFLFGKSDFLSIDLVFLTTEVFGSTLTFFGKGFVFSGEIWIIFLLTLVVLRCDLTELFFTSFILLSFSSSSSSSHSSIPTKLNAERRFGVIGMKNGDGHGELIGISVVVVDDAFDLIDGTRIIVGFILEGVLGSLQIGLKKIISVFNESGDEQSLAGVWLSLLLLLLLFLSEVLFEPVEEPEDGDPELLVILDRKLMPLLRADLKILYLLSDAFESLILDDVLTQEGDEDDLSLKVKNWKFTKINFQTKLEQMF